jgi:hypothetical protein
MSPENFGESVGVRSNSVISGALVISALGSATSALAEAFAFAAITRPALTADQALQGTAR